MYGDNPVSEQCAFHSCAKGLTKQLLVRLPKRSIGLADRNFGIFSMAYHAGKHEHSVIFRLTDARAKKLNGGVLPNAGTERVIRWTPSRDDRRNNPEIPADAVVEGRLLAFKLHDKFGPPMKMFLFTTLDLPKDKILELYGYRPKFPE